MPPSTTPAERPGPGARVVGRPRIASLLGFCAIGGIGGSLIAEGSGVGIGFGALLAAVALLGLAVTLRTRVWVDGSRLYARRLVGYAPPVRIDRLTAASLSPFGRNNGRDLTLRDADGTTLRLDATNTRLARLYAVLATYVRHDDPAANALLQRRMARHRPGLPLGPG